MKTIFTIGLPAGGLCATPSVAQTRALAAAMICTGGETPAAAKGCAHTKRQGPW